MASDRVHLQEPLTGLAPRDIRNHKCLERPRVGAFVSLSKKLRPLTLSSLSHEAGGQVLPQKIPELLLWRNGVWGTLAEGKVGAAEVGVSASPNPVPKTSQVPQTDLQGE